LKPKRYVGYVRISTEGQRFNTSSDDQEKIIVEYCAKHGIELVRIFKDIARSGKDTYDREQYNQMISFILNPDNQIDGIMTTKTDRLHRKVANLLYFCETIVKGNDPSGKKVRDEMNYISTEERIDLSTEEGKNWIVFLGWLAEKERELIFERTKAGRKSTALQQKYAGGKVPYGYKVVDKKVEVDIDEAIVVQFIFTWYNHGKTAYWIKNFLNDFKLLNPKFQTRAEKKAVSEGNCKKTYEWHECSIFSIVRNDAYLGIYKYDGKIEKNGIIIKDNVIPQLIIKETWEEARKQDKRLRKGDFTRKPPKVVAYIRGNEEHKKEEIQKTCKELGYELVKIFEDSMARSDYLQMIRFTQLKQNKIKGILCYSMYELHEEYDGFLDMLEDNFDGMKQKPFVYSVTEKIDSTTEEKLDEIGLLINKEKRKRRTYKKSISLIKGEK